MQIDNQISVRAPGTSVGGGVEDDAWVIGDRISGRSRALLFVHGYNNSQQDAERAYDTFSGHVFGASATGQTTFPMFGFFWPGDTHIKIISTLSYPTRIGPAKKSAERLFQYLQTATGPNGGPLELNLVGHSLGCRVILELLKRFAAARGRTAVTIGSVVLMAAAVPVSKVEDRKSLGEAAASPARSLVLHSEGDMVLFLAFPPGETLAFDAFWPSAVGRHGEPLDVWTTGSPMASAGGQRYGHSDYWKGIESSAAAAVALGVPVQPPLSVHAQPEHELVPPHETPDHDLAGRSLVTASSFG